MRNLTWLAVSILLGLPAAAQDVAGSSDHPLVPRYPGSSICVYDVEEFGRYRLVVGPEKVEPPKASMVTESLEGRVTRITYGLRGERSSLEVFRNYELALKEAGFEQVWRCEAEQCVEHSWAPEKYAWHFSDSNPNLERRYCRDYARFGNRMSDGVHQRYLAAKLTRPAEGDVYAAVYATRDEGESVVVVQVDIVEMTPMDVGMELKLANEMKREISREGRSVLYDILFDYDSAVIKPESEPALEEIQKLMNGDPTLKLLVVGHTDNQGGLEYNLDLSMRRARAVADALVSRYGVARSRLEGHGVGFLAPVASNDSEKGRELNRRVELVKR
jgi:outer membrane protein OmpA-like peptidoglycan-associated protein